MPVEFKRKLFDIDEYVRLFDAGILRDDDRVELLDGQIFEMSPTGYGHSRAMVLLNRILINRFAEPLGVLPASSLPLSPRSMPEPDFAILKADVFRRPGRGSFAPLDLHDVLLVVEVADSSLRYDRMQKAPVYARAGIAEYWIVDVAGEAVEVYSEPANDGYGRCDRVSRGETIPSSILQGEPLLVDDLF